MHGSFHKGFRSAAAAAALCLLASTVGCGVEPDEEDSVTGAATSDLIINCPDVATVDWIQAANGKQNVIHGQLKNAIWRDQPKNLIACSFTNASPPPLVQQLVSFKPGTVESQCGAKATITARATTSGSVPPFEGFVFKTKRIQANATYDQKTGICLLTLPTAGQVWPNDIALLTVSKPCRSVGDTSYRCPFGTHVVE